MSTFGISNIGDWILFEIWFLSFGIFKFCQESTEFGATGTKAVEPANSKHQTAKSQTRATPKTCQKMTEFDSSGTNGIGS